jgi:hypothetical protein
MEASGGAHDWAREIEKLGQTFASRRSAREDPMRRGPAALALEKRCVNLPDGDRCHADD